MSNGIFIAGKFAVGLFVGVVIFSNHANAQNERSHSNHENKSHFEFGHWGDMPYAKNGDDPKVTALIADMNTAKLTFTMMHLCIPGLNVMNKPETVILKFLFRHLKPPASRQIPLLRWQRCCVSRLLLWLLWGY